MPRFTFLSPDGSEIPPNEWLRLWSALYPATDDDEHADLIANHDSFSSDEFERIGKWKDGAQSPGRWRANVASVGYLIWMQAASELPKCPEQADVARFLKEWSERTYKDTYQTGSERIKCFGLSRATTLLHFVSGGEYPIFDSNAIAGMAKLLSAKVPYDIRTYLTLYCPSFNEIAVLSEASNLREVDKALFAYGIHWRRRA